MAFTQTFGTIASICGLAAGLYGVVTFILFKPVEDVDIFRRRLYLFTDSLGVLGATLMMVSVWLDKFRLRQVFLAYCIFKTFLTVLMMVLHGLGMLVEDMVYLHINMTLYVAAALAVGIAYQDEKFF